MTCLGFDTSNYTTSCAAFGAEGACFVSRLLDVQPGQLGLRQSDALFSHVKRLPDLTSQLAAQMTGKITSIAASTRPRAVEGSYMPCFLAGSSFAESMANLIGVPFYAFSHQQGHIAAVLWSAERLDLLHRPFLSWHLSGGTTELLLVEPNGLDLHATIIGGARDLSAGQLIDRTGKLMELQFPAGKALDRLSGEGEAKPFPVKVEDSYFSLSGTQNQLERLYQSGASAADVAKSALRTICKTVKTATEQALLQHPDYPVVFSGGVSSNSMLRKIMRPMGTIFGEPQFSTDNAMGIAVLGHLREAEK
jgi:N6-L-threonylcarbamoyladenine synthase